jgi:hypothetical protein
MRSLLSLSIAVCGCEAVTLDFIESEGARSELLVLHTASGVRVHAFSRDEPFAFEFDEREPFAVESLLYEETLGELGIEPGALERVDGPSRGLPAARESYRREVTPRGDEGEWTRTETPSAEADTFRIAGSCALIEETLVPFAANAVAIDSDDEGVGEIRVRKLVLVDEDSLLALTSYGLYFIHRGEDYRATPATSFRSSYPLRSFELDRATGRVFVVGKNLLSELSLDASGLTVVTASVAGCAHPLDILEEVVLDAEGRPWIATDKGASCRYEGAGVFTPLGAVPLLFNGNVLSMIALDDPSFPLLAGSSAFLHRYDAAQNYWTIEEGIRDLSPVFLPYALAARGTEHFAAGTGPRIFRQSGNGDWAPEPLRFPPEYSPCATGRYPDIVETDTIRVMSAAEDRLWITTEFCSAIIELDPTGRCSRLATIGGGATEGDSFDAIGQLGETVVTGGTNGVIYTARARR